MKETNNLVVENEASEVKIRLNGTVAPDYYSDYDGFITAKSVSDAFEEAGGKDVRLYVNSNGGDVFTGIEIYNTIKNYQGKVTTHVMGAARSAASFFILSSDHIKMELATEYMIHHPWTYVVGNASDLRAVAERMDEISDSIMDIYMERFKGTREELKKAMDKETTYKPSEAKEMGFIDDFETAKAEEPTNAKKEDEDILSEENIKLIAKKAAEFLNKMNAKEDTEPTEPTPEPSFMERFKK